MQNMNNINNQKISAKEAKELMDKADYYTVLDVRTKEEYDKKHIPHSILIPYDELYQKAETELKDKEQLILVYCQSGHRSSAAIEILSDLGYKNAKDFGGIHDWPYEAECN